MAAATVRVQGLNALIRDLRSMEGGLAQEVRKELLEVGKPVAEDARGRLSAYNPTSAAGIRARLRGAATVTVEQSKGRTTGKRPDWGALVMRRALSPALDARSADVVSGLEQMLGRFASRHGF